MLPVLAAMALGGLVKGILGHRSQSKANDAEFEQQQAKADAERNRRKGRASIGRALLKATGMDDGRMPIDFDAYENAGPSPVKRKSDLLGSLMGGVAGGVGDFFGQKTGLPGTTPGTPSVGTSKTTSSSSMSSPFAYDGDTGQDDGLEDPLHWLDPKKISAGLGLG